MTVSKSHKGLPLACGWGRFRPRPGGRVGGEPRLTPRGDLNSERHVCPAVGQFGELR